MDKPVNEIIEESMANSYSKHLAQAMGDTKMRIINQIFVDEYAKWKAYRIEMPRRGRYQVWQGNVMLADRIKHRKEALAVLKLIKENDNGTS